MPAPTPLSAGFWEAARRHRLVVQRCELRPATGTTRRTLPGVPSADWDWSPVSGRGVIYTFTVTHRPFHPAWAAHAAVRRGDRRTGRGRADGQRPAPEDTEPVRIGCRSRSSSTTRDPSRCPDSAWPGEPVSVHPTDDVLLDLRRRLPHTIPPPSPAEPWSDGTDRGFLGELLEYWRDGYDLARAGGAYQRPPAIPGRGRRPEAARRDVRSAVVTRRPLLRPRGGPVRPGVPPHPPPDHPLRPRRRPARRLLCRHPASLPAMALVGRAWYAPGCDPAAIASGIAVLMAGLGYDRYAAQGARLGTVIAAELGWRMPTTLSAVHLNLPQLHPPPPDYDGSGLAPAGPRGLGRRAVVRRDGLAYLDLAVDPPETPAFGLSDSPTGLAAWIARIPRVVRRRARHRHRPR